MYILAGSSPSSPCSPPPPLASPVHTKGSQGETFCPTVTWQSPCWDLLQHCQPHVTPWRGLVISRSPQHTEPAGVEENRTEESQQPNNGLQGSPTQCRAAGQCQKAGLEKARDRPKICETQNLKQLSDSWRWDWRSELAILSNKAHIFWIWMEWRYHKATHQRTPPRSVRHALSQKKIMSKAEFAEKRISDQQRERHNPT